MNIPPQYVLCITIMHHQVSSVLYLTGMCHVFDTKYLSQEIYDNFSFFLSPKGLI